VDLGLARLVPTARGPSCVVLNVSEDMMPVIVIYIDLNHGFKVSIKNKCKDAMFTRKCRPWIPREFMNPHDILQDIRFI
jgi:hypothetical protein